MSSSGVMARTEAITQANAILVDRYGLPFFDVIKDVHDSSTLPIEEVAAGVVGLDEFVATVAKDHGLVPGDGRGNAYRCALVAFARETGWISAKDGRIYTEFDERLVRVGVDDGAGEDRVFIGEIAPECRLEMSEEGFDLPEQVPFSEVCRGLDINDVLEQLDVILAPDPAPEPLRNAF